MNSAIATISSRGNPPDSAATTPIRKASTHACSMDRGTTHSARPSMASIAVVSSANASGSRPSILSHPLPTSFPPGPSNSKRSKLNPGEARSRAGSHSRRRSALASRLRPLAGSDASRAARASLKSAAADKSIPLSVTRAKPGPKVSSPQVSASKLNTPCISSSRPDPVRASNWRCPPPMLPRDKGS